MVQEESPSPGGRTVPTAEYQAPRLLQLLRSPRQLCQLGPVLLSGATAAFEVAESTQPAPELQLGWLPRTTSALRARSATHRRAFHTRPTLGLPAEASINEEPGAGKLHAGICAGAVG